MRSHPLQQRVLATWIAATKVNGRHVGDGAGAPVRHQNDETKPILGPEAE